MEITKNGIPYIDISGVNCWIAYLIPYSKENRIDYDEIVRFQNECIKKKIFGMGWNSDAFKSEKEAAIKKEYDIKENDTFKKFYKGKDESAITAFEKYKEINPGDYVIFRSKESHYYIGKVTTNAYYRVNEDEKDLLAWRCKVEKWVEYKTQEEIASEIVGRFSQRQHKTIDRICDYRLKLSVIAAYENGKDTEGNYLDESKKKYRIPKIKIDKNNFVSCLNYTELEDVVYTYINSLHKDEGYKLYPSSCKVNHQKYEYTFFHKTKNPITCQVKNRHEINVDDYKGESKMYEKIYLFSGYGFTKETINSYKDSNIVLISQADLYSALDEYLTHRNLSNFYHYDKNAQSNLQKLDLSKFEKTERWSSDNKRRLTQYKVFDQKIEFFDKNIFYSEEFDALIIESNKSQKTLEYVKENLEYKLTSP